MRFRVRLETSRSSPAADPGVAGALAVRQVERPPVKKDMASLRLVVFRGGADTTAGAAVLAVGPQRAQECVRSVLTGHRYECSICYGDMSRVRRVPAGCYPARLVRGII